MPFFGQDFESRSLEKAMDETRLFVSQWYSRLPEGYFDNPAPFPDGTSRREGARKWERGLQQWKAERIDSDNVVLWFENPDGSGEPYGLRHQAYGSPPGGVRPVKARALTIPLTAKAKGRTTALFESETGLELFLVKNRKNTDPDLIGTLCWEDDLGELHAAYALRTRSVLAPLKQRRGHEAMPDEETLSSRFTDAYFKELFK